jgi:DNA segregation ATPase FtsK/SpoIIIE, S-DNA-T family
VLVDGIGSLLAEFEGTDGLEQGERFRRVFNDGPTVGIVFAVTGDRIGRCPPATAPRSPASCCSGTPTPTSSVPSGSAPARCPASSPAGRSTARRTSSSRSPTPATPPRGSRRSPRWDGTAGPPKLRSLPAAVELAELPAGRLDGEDVLDLPIAVAEEDLRPVALRLHPGEHALVAGPPRSGTTSTLATLAHQVRAADPQAVIVALCGARSPLYGLEPLDAAGSLADLAGVVRAALTDPRRWVVLIDDAPGVDDVDGILASLLASRRPGLHLVGGAHRRPAWRVRPLVTAAAAGPRRGAAPPNLTADGELLGVRLPRRVAVGLGVAGRGFVVTEGEAVLGRSRARRCRRRSTERSTVGRRRLAPTRGPAVRGRRGTR